MLQIKSIDLKYNVNEKLHYKPKRITKKYQIKDKGFSVEFYYTPMSVCCYIWIENKKYGGSGKSTSKNGYYYYCESQALQEALENIGITLSYNIQGGRASMVSQVVSLIVDKLGYNRLDVRYLD